MLAQKYYILIYMSILLGTKLNILLFDFNPLTKQWSIQKSKRKQHLWKLYFGLSSLRFSYELWGFCRTVLWPREYFTLETFPIHVIFSFGSVMCLYNNFKHYVVHPEVAISVITDFVQDNTNGQELNWKNLSVQEIVTMCLPLHLFLGVGFYIGLLVRTPEASYMAFSAVKPEWRNWFTFFICAFVDIAVMLFYLWPLVLSAFSTLVFFDKCTHQISTFNRIIQKRAQERKLKPLHLVYFYWKCRHLQLWIQIFNLCYADLIFLFKILNLLLGIILISFAVLLFEKSVLQAAVFFHIGVTGGLIFNVAFERAFSIPLSLNRCKVSIITASKRFTISKIICKRVKSIPPIAINVGGFHKLGRMSAVNFWSFVIRNIFRILLAFQ